MTVRKKKITPQRLSIADLNANKKSLFWKGWVYPGEASPCLVCRTQTSARVRCLFTTTDKVINGALCETCAGRAGLA